MKENKDLLDKLASLGFPLLRPEEAQDANAVLAEVVESEDLRLWEGFPVVVANSADRGMFDYNDVAKLIDARYQSYFVALMAMSLALYEALGLKFTWTEKVREALPPQGKESLSEFLKRLKKDTDLKLADVVMSAKRLKSTFNNYFARSRSELGELVLAKEEMALERALSQVFSPKQRELFLKKLKGEKLSKTENEYFSRVVRKKVLALANPELYRLSQRLAQS